MNIYDFDNGTKLDNYKILQDILNAVKYYTNLTFVPKLYRYDRHDFKIETDRSINVIMGGHEKIEWHFEIFYNSFTETNNAQRILELSKEFGAFCIAMNLSGNEHIETTIIYLNSGKKFRECAEEEIVQSLGLIGDYNEGKHTMFNDINGIKNIQKVDWLMLHILYQTEIQSGLKLQEVRRDISDQISILFDE